MRRDASHRIRSKPPIFDGEEDQREENVPIRPRLIPPGHARCGHCGSEEVSALPTFSAGSGIAYRPMADDVICRRCGTIGPYEL